MINKQRLLEIIPAYKEYFKVYWKEEKYKWEAIKHFQDNWDIDAPNFKEMLSESFSKTINLLRSGYFYPLSMIETFAEEDPEATKAAFRSLFDESKDLKKRVDAFISFGEDRRVNHNESGWGNHFQNSNSVSTYLWLKYPDKYTIYKYTEYREVAKELESDFIPRKTADIGNMVRGLAMYDEINAVLLEDSSLREMLDDALTDDCYPDPQLRTMTVDIGFFISRFLHQDEKPTDKSGNIEGSDVWEPSLEEYSPGISKERWVELLNNPDIIGSVWGSALAEIYDIGGEASCKQIADRYGHNSQSVNGKFLNLAKHIYEVTNCPLRVSEDRSNSYWPILFQGRYPKNEPGTWVYRLRQELKEAIEETNIIRFLNTPDSTPEEVEEDEHDTNIPKNLILYGPPGTGKTYYTVYYAVAIIEKKDLEDVRKEDYSSVVRRYNNYKEQGLIEFTTFHQSYGYEEFIEGIRPNMDENTEESGDVQYTIQPGIFKSFCEAAARPVLKKASNIGINANPTVWKVSLGGAGDNSTRRECLANNHIRIGYDSYGEDINEQTEIKEGKAVLNAFISRMKVGDIVFSCYSATTIDAIGVVTGEYEWHNEYDQYKRLRKVRWLVKDIKEDITKINGGTSMTLSSTYALNNVTLADVMKLLDRVAPNATMVEKKRPNYVFIIDEINRGNISKIFGELITLIETYKRTGQGEGMTVKLPYSQKPFGVPDNVYLLGTMNTADRSIATIDTALRRRFKFIEIQPDIKVLDGIEVEGLNISEMLERMNKRISVLYDREHTIGHAYFIPLKEKPTIETLSEIFKNNILPLLQEYFYEDYEKIRLVLGDNRKGNEEDQFIIVRNNDYNDLFGETDLDFDESVSYEINTKAFDSIEAYKSI